MEVSRILEYIIAFLALYVTVFFLLVFIFNRQKVGKVPASTNWAPRISVLIPAYNESRNIRKCLETVLALDYPKEKLEILVIDDGSKDNTAEIARSLKDRRIRVFTKNNEGKAIALNYGIARAKGEVIATLDADSYVTPGVIRKMLPFFSEQGVMAVTAAVKVDDPKNLLEHLQKVEYLYTLFSRKVLEFIDSIQVTPGPFSMFRAEVFGKIGGFDPTNILEDQEIAMRIQSHNYMIRSSLDAEVYTVVPATFRGLLKQRTRWHRGGLRNSIKYLELIGPKYGDFGMIVMPLGFMAVLAIFAVFFINFDALLARNMMFSLDPELLIMGLRPLHIISFALLLLTVLWIGYGLLFFKEEKIKPHIALLYIVSYAYLLTLFWISAIFHEVKGAKLTW